MNNTSKILVIGLALALSACGRPTQSDVNQAARNRATDVAKASQAAQPAVDAANRNLVTAQQNANIKIANATAAAGHSINKATVIQAKAQAKADYNVAIARIEGNLKVAQEKCAMQPADAQTACEQNAQAIHGQDVSAAVARLDAVNQQPD